MARIASATVCPCDTRTSTCRSLATASSGRCFLLAISVLLRFEPIPQLDFARVGPEPERQASDFPEGAQPERPFTTSRGQRGERKTRPSRGLARNPRYNRLESTRKSGVD